MILSMVKLQIIGTKRCQDDVVQLLYRLGAIQIDDWSESRALSQQRMVISDQAIQMRQRLINATARVEAVLAALPAGDGFSASEYEALDVRPVDWLLREVEADLAQVTPQTQALATRHDQLQGQLASFARYQATLEQLLPVVPAIVDLERFATTVVFVESHHHADLESISHQLEKLTEGQCDVISSQVSQDMCAAVLVFPKANARSVAELLGRENVAQVRLPAELAGQSFQQALAHLRARLRSIPGELAEVETQLAALARAARPRLLIWQALLHDRSACIEVCSSFGETEYTFVIEGWLPERRVADLEAALRQEAGDETLLAVLPLSADEQKRAPVVLDNLAFARPFEPLVGLLSIPRYGSLDPTVLMAIFFPLFFGMMVGDIAYGSILLALMIYLRIRFRTRPMLSSLAEALIMGCAWSIIFGFLHGEFLGEIGSEYFGLRPLWFDRGPENIVRLFLITLGIGAGHVVLGLCLGLWDALRRRSRHQVMEKAGMLVALSGLFLIAAVLARQLPASFTTPATGLFLVGLVILIQGLGRMGPILGPLELIGTLSNIVSYLRIAAIGLSSVYLAVVARELAGIGNVVIGLIIAVFFHALNLALGAFAPTIHSLRLHYVEFFRQFYESGGQPFRPFQRSVAGAKPLHAAGRRG